MIGLIDADTIAYITAQQLEYEVSEGVFDLDLELAYQTAVDRLNHIVRDTGVEDVELYFSSGSTFRHELTSTYKANRQNLRYPAKLKELKELLNKNFDGEICEGYEADDKVVLLKSLYPNKYLLCAIDKDVLNNVAGKHYNYYHNNPRFVEITQIEALKYPYYQTLIGDKADNIKGCPYIGKVKANKLLQGVTDEVEMWKRVVEAYKKAKLTEEDALLTMRLVNMHQLQLDGSIKLWQPPIQNIKDEKMDLNNILETRTKIYGDYKGNVNFRRNLIKLIRKRYKEVNGEELPEDFEVMIQDLVAKVARVASSPNHLDSWVDIGGYSQLIAELLSEESK